MPRKSDLGTQSGNSILLIGGGGHCKSCIKVLKDRKERDAFLEATNARGVQTRPVWALMNHLPMYRNCYTADLDNAEWLEDRLVNIPSSMRI